MFSEILNLSFLISHFFTLLVLRRNLNSFIIDVSGNGSIFRQQNVEDDKLYHRVVKYCNDVSKVNFWKTLNAIIQFNMFLFLFSKCRVYELGRLASVQIGRGIVFRREEVSLLHRFKGWALSIHSQYVLIWASWPGLTSTGQTRCFHSKLRIIVGAQIYLTIWGKKFFLLKLKVSP